MGRWRDDEQTRRNRSLRVGQRGYDQPRRGEQGYGRRDYRDEDERYYRDRDREREYYWREREQRQQTRRTGMMVIGAICLALIALVGVMAVTGDDPSQSAQQTPQQQQSVEPQQPAQQPPQAPQQDGASAAQVEGMQPDIERQLAEIRQSINQLRFEIWSSFGGQQSNKQDTQQ